MLEIGLVIYPGAQQAAIFGLTDLFAVANQSAVAHQQTREPVLRISHWQPEPATSTVDKVFDRYPEGEQSTLTALILPPALGEPVAPADDLLLTWLQAQHAQGVMLGSVCAGAFQLANYCNSATPPSTAWRGKLVTAMPALSARSLPTLSDYHRAPTVSASLQLVSLTDQ
ncbi:hypothetical protein [Halopseudomonas bauzanensis]|uniref:hypothetical protein n=1 Tax=Halopseudomonas bauzanensis TaxID=653930 RepID=UPI003DAA1C5F